MSKLRGQIDTTGLPFDMFVVRDVISTPSILSNQTLAGIMLNIFDKQHQEVFADTSKVGEELHVSIKAPRNSIIVSKYPATDGSPVFLLLPFFSSHLTLPINSGS